MKPSPQHDFPVGIVNASDEKPDSKAMYAGIYSARLNHSVYVDFVPEFERAPWPPRLPDNVDDVKSIDTARRIAVAGSFYVVTPDEARKDSIETFPDPQADEDPILRGEGRLISVFYVGVAEFEELSGELQALSDKMSGIYDSVPVSELNGTALGRVLLERIVPSGQLSARHLYMLGRSSSADLIYSRRVTARLDELARSVRDARSRLYIEEVIAAHRAGANRAAIVSLWTTIVYDLIQKVRELAASGNECAVAFIARYEGAVERNDIRVFLKIEEDVLDTAQREFQMLQQHEAAALERVRQDRHLCAHPAMTLNETLFQPTPELVQSHVVHAISYLLAVQPMQGKAALNRILEDITSKTFPSDLEHATRFLADRYLARAKPSLIRNLTIVLLKKHVGPSAEGDIESFTLALNACLGAARSECEVAIQEHLPRLASHTRHERLLNILALADIDERCWRWVDEPARIQLREIFKTGQHQTLYTPRILQSASRIDELRSFITNGYETLDFEQQLRIAELNPRKEYIPVWITRYAQAFSFRSAGTIGERALVPLAPHMSSADVIEIIQAARGNGQVYLAAETPDVLAAVFDATRHHLPQTYQAWKAFVEQRRAAETDPNEYYAYPDLARRLEMT